MSRVLIVDDSPIIRKQLSKIFIDGLKYEVVGEARDGQEAVEGYQKCQPDLVTLDLSMPRKTGLETLAEIMELNSDARVVVISAISEAASITQALKAGARGYINKPLRIQEEAFIERFRQEIEDALSNSAD